MCVSNDGFGARAVQLARGEHAVGCGITRRILITIFVPFCIWPDTVNSFPHRGGVGSTHIGSVFLPCDNADKIAGPGGILHTTWRGDDWLFGLLQSDEL